MTSPTVTDLQVITTAPDNMPLTIVRLDTSEPGLYGLGCATWRRHTATVTAIEEYLRPFVVGLDVHRVEDIFQAGLNKSYWRNGPVLNNALSGVDMALWDIKAKLAGMPLYQLLGGKCREAAAAYAHAGALNAEAVADSVAELRAAGFRYVRCQLGGYGGQGHRLHSPDGAQEGQYYDARQYARSVPAMLEKVRDVVGFDVELLHDVHERLSPAQVMWLARAVEPYQLFFLEDPLAPEQIEWFSHLRQVTTTPIAMGELWVNPTEWIPLVSGALVDFARAHVSSLGGITPARKMAAYCELHSVRTAWHGPENVSPVGHAANVHLDVACPNFGIQECYQFPDIVREVFPGCPEIRDGYIYPNDEPGLGIDVNISLANRYPATEEFEHPVIRLPDGTAARF